MASGDNDDTVTRTGCTRGGEAMEFDFTGHFKGIGKGGVDATNPHQRVPGSSP
jgi:hypothetical protein